MEAKRLIWADALKGWLIILVVLGHAIQHTLGNAAETNHLWNIIYSFHMPAFMAISGYLAYRPSKTNGKYSLWFYIIRRFRQLIIPFVLWTFLLLLIKTGLSVGVIKDYFFYPDKGLWFLWVLFFITVIFIIGGKISEIIKVKQELINLLICLLLAGAMIYLELRVLGFQFIAYYYLFYSLGFYLNKYKERVVTKNPYAISFLLVIWFVMAWFWQMHELPYFLKNIPLPNSLVQYMYRFITASIAVYILVATSPRLIDKDSICNKPFVKIGRISLGIYTTHVIVLGSIVSIIENVVTSKALVIIFSFISGLFFSWLLVWLLSKWNITSKLLLGKI